MFCGRVSETVILPTRGHMCTADNRLIFRGLTNRSGRPEHELGLYLAGVSGGSVFDVALGTDAPRIEDECIFLGGSMNVDRFCSKMYCAFLS